MKMVMDSPNVPLVALNLELFCDVKIMFLMCLMLMLEIVNSLVKFAQLHNVFVCDFVVVMKICQDDFHKLHVDLVVAFNGDLF
jgi:hypothetical protein